MARNVSLNGLRFRSVRNTPNGDVSDETVFEYHQQGPLVWATYEGGRIRFGQLLGRVSESGEIEIRYQQLNDSNMLMTGICVTTPVRIAGGRLQLHERWQWTSGDGSAGYSVVEQIDR